MQRVTAALSLMVVAALVYVAAKADLLPYEQRTVVVLAIGVVVAGALLVIVFARDGVIPRLRKGMMVGSVLAASITIARGIWCAPDGEVTDWSSCVAVAGSELLAGTAAAVLLGLLGKRPAKSDDGSTQAK